MKSAIIGTGLIAHTHAKALRECGEDIALVIGHSEKSAQAFAEKFGISRYDSELTRENIENIDCVHICTPPSLHYEAARLCLEEGKHVICEKPLTVDPWESAELKRFSAVHDDTVTAVVFNNRFYPAVTAMRSMILKKEAGPLLFAFGHYFQEYDILPAPYSWRCAADRPDSRFRSVTEIGSHSIDLLEFLTGQSVEKVCALFTHAHPERYLRDGIMYTDGSEAERITVKNEDAASLMFRMSDGTAASIVLSEVSPGRSNDVSIELVYDQASFSWSSERPYEICTGKKGSGITTNQYDFGGGFSTTFTDCFREAYDCMKQKRKSGVPASFAQGEHVVMVCESIGRSARNDGVWIDVNEVAHEYEG
ncbi:MAG: Gfo/Idh/MocA family oxidoreductase [Treponema sp.]|nr:Gfo/Idh/MocA family oxidoreductase [Treponema sp.]